MSKSSRNPFTVVESISDPRIQGTVDFLEVMYEVGVDVAPSTPVKNFEVRWVAQRLYAISRDRKVDDFLLRTIKHLS